MLSLVSAKQPAKDVLVFCLGWAAGVTACDVVGWLVGHEKLVEVRHRFLRISFVK